MFEMLMKKIWHNFQRIKELFTQKIVTKLSKIWVWDLGVKKAPDPGSGSATLNMTDSILLWCLYSQLVHAWEKENLRGEKDRQRWTVRK
jgi:hypothetical protein